MPLSNAPCLRDHSPSFYHTSAREKTPPLQPFVAAQAAFLNIQYMLLGIKCNRITIALFCACDDGNHQTETTKVAAFFESLSVFFQKHIFQSQFTPIHPHLRGVFTWACDRGWSPGADIPPPGLWWDVFKHLSEAFYHLAIKKWKVFYCAQD